MKILNELPPIYDAILANGMHPTSTVVYTYGDTLYNPSGAEISEHLMCHEETHSHQQGSNPDAWWGRYLIDPFFRLKEEAEAYANQYDFICLTVKDRNRRYFVLNDLASHLASPIYGDVISKDTARKLIKNKSKTQP